MGIEGRGSWKGGQPGGEDSVWAVRGPSVSGGAAASLGQGEGVATVVIAEHGHGGSGESGGREGKEEATVVELQCDPTLPWLGGGQLQSQEEKEKR